MKYLLFIMLILAMGCQQQEAPLQISQESSQEDITFLAKPADNSGSEVLRYKISPWHYWFLDAENGLLGMHVAHPAYCELGTDIAELYQQLVVHPEHQQDLVMELSKSKDHPLFVFNWEGLTSSDIYTWECDTVQCWTTGFNCDLLMNRLIASGTGQLVISDNDLYHWLNHDRMRVNTFGGRGQGKLTDTEGNSYHYSALYKQTWALNKDNGFYMEWINFGIKGN